MEAGNRKIKDWFARISTKQIKLPRFQRYEAWGYDKIEELLTSIIRDLPVGSTLIQQVGDKLPFKCHPIKGAPEKGERTNELLLDGQQRLTALWRSLKDDYPNKTYFVTLENEDEEENKPRVIVKTRWKKNETRYPLNLDNPKKCWREKLIPVSLLDPDNEAENKKWAIAAVDGDSARAIDLIVLIGKLREQVANFNLPYLYLPVVTPRSLGHDSAGSDWESFMGIQWERLSPAELFTQPQGRQSMPIYRVYSFSFP